MEKKAPDAFAAVRGETKTRCANVDLYSGFIYGMLGIPKELYTPMFAIARVAGWCAHRIEELASGTKVMRPAYKFVRGDRNGYIPLDQRD